jgi:hypothetical protein
MTDPPNALTTSEVAPLLRAAAETFRVELTALPTPLLSWHPAPGEWCALEVVGHLIEAEQRGFAGRIRIILAESEPTFATWDPPAVARARHDCERPLADLLSEFLTIRASSATLVEGLQDADLTRGGHHPEVGYLRVVDLLHEWVSHDRNHIKQLHSNVQSYVWPNMGNTQRFSGE